MVHRDLVGMQGGGHAHGSKLCFYVGRNVRFFCGPAHTPFPISVAKRDQFFGKGSGLVLVKVDEFVIVTRGKAKPCWAEDKGCGNHQQNHANRRQSLRSKYICTSPPRLGFFKTGCGLFLGIFLQTQQGRIGGCRR